MCAVHSRCLFQIKIINIFLIHFWYRSDAYWAKIEKKTAQIFRLDEYFWISSTFEMRMKFEKKFKSSFKVLRKAHSPNKSTTLMRIFNKGSISICAHFSNSSILFGANFKIIYVKFNTKQQRFYKYANFWRKTIEFPIIILPADVIARNWCGFELHSAQFDFLRKRTRNASLI